ncbi:unnamed protein product [Brassica rapa subsp. narinosa]
MIMELVKGEKEWHGGVYWYSPAGSYPWQHGHLSWVYKFFFCFRGLGERRRNTGFVSVVGLRFLVVERMRRVMEEGGWVFLEWSEMNKLVFLEEIWVEKSRWSVVGQLFI